MVHPNWQATELLEEYKLHTLQQAFVEPNYAWVHHETQKDHSQDHLNLWNLQI